MDSVTEKRASSAEIETGRCVCLFCFFRRLDNIGEYNSVSLVYSLRCRVPCVRALREM